MGEEGGRERVGVARGLGRDQFLVLGKRRARGRGRRGGVSEGEGCVSGVWICALALGEVQHKRGWPREKLTPEPTSFSKYFCM